MHIMTDTEIRQWTHPKLPLELLQSWTVQGDRPCETDCSDITSSNDSNATSSSKGMDSHNRIQNSNTRRKQQRERSRNGIHHGHINTAINTRTTPSITVRQIDSQTSSESSGTSDTEDDMITCTTIQSRTYGRFLAPFVHFAHMTHRTLFGGMDAREENESIHSDSHTSDEPVHRKAAYSRNRHL